MKKLLLFFVFCYATTLISQVTNEGEPASWGFAEKSSLEAISLPQIDIKKIKTEDDINDKLREKPYRVGISHKVNYGLENSGIWTQLPNGDRIWRILFSSKDAVHLSVNFDNSYLPKGASIYLYNDDRTDLLGAYTDTSNNDKQVLGTWFVNGDKLWIEYYEPKKVKGQGIINLSSVIHGYRMGHNYQEGNFGSSEGTQMSSVNTLAVNDEFLEQNISVFPNPTSGFVQIKIRQWTSDMDYEVYNILGQTLKTNRLQNNEILDFTDLPSDMYFIKITELETNRTLVKKIVLNK